MRSRWVYNILQFLSLSFRYKYYKKKRYVGSNEGSTHFYPTSL